MVVGDFDARLEPGEPGGTGSGLAAVHRWNQRMMTASGATSLPKEIRSLAAGLPLM